MDWTKSMIQTFEFYSVDPDTWENSAIIDTIKSATINIDSESDTVYSATINSTNSFNEQYIRIYLVATQNNISEKYPLGTFLIQAPSSKFNGRVHDISIEAYSPLLELKDNKPPIGYTILKSEKSNETNETIMSLASRICENYVRAPVIASDSNEKLTENYTAESTETWLSYLSSLVAKAKFKINLDELGRIIFTPVQEISAMQARFTYDDNEVSILQPEITINKDIYGIPNVVEVIYSGSSGKYLYSKIENNDPGSIVSTINRGRIVLYRETDPKLPGTPTQEQLDEYARILLKSKSSIKGTISYKHGFCPVRVGDCIYINYNRANIQDLKAVVTSQSIECKTGCQVSETAAFTDVLWED